MNKTQVFQDKYISTLEEILSLRQELQSKSMLLIKVEENISLKVCKVSELERKLFGCSSTLPISHNQIIKKQEIFTPRHEQRHHQRQQLHLDTRPQPLEKPRQQPGGQENTPKESNKPKKAKTSSAKKRKRTPADPKKKISIRKNQEIEKKEIETKELPPIEIDPTKHVEWTAALQESVICWNEIIKSTHPGSLGLMGFGDKFRIEQSVHDFLSTKLDWRDIQYCVALNRQNIPFISIPEDWVDEFSDWFSERVGAGLLDSKVRAKKRSAKMQPVLGVKHGNEYQEFPDVMALVNPKFRSWLEIVRIRFPVFVSGFIHEEFVRDYLLSRNIAFEIVEAEFETDNHWGIPSEMEEQFFNAFMTMFHYHLNGNSKKVFPKTNWQIPKCRSLEYLNGEKEKSCGSSIIDLNENQPCLDSLFNAKELLSESQTRTGFFGSNHVQMACPFRKAVVNGTELFHWRDVVEDKFASKYDELLNKPNNQILIHNVIRHFLNGSLLPAGLEPKNCFICFSDDSDSEEEDAEEANDYGIPSILKEEFELWFSYQADYGFKTLSQEKEDDEDEFDDDQLKSQ